MIKPKQGVTNPMTVIAIFATLTETSAASGLDLQRVDTLLTRYGTRALQVALHEGGWNAPERLPDSHDYSLAEIDCIVRNEFVEHLADVVMRRTTLAVTGSLTLQDLNAIAVVAGGAGGWGPERLEEEVAATVTQLTVKNLMRL